MPKRTMDYDSWQLEKLSDPVSAIHYLNAAANDSREMFQVALQNVVKAQRQMTSVAREAGVTRESLYRSFSREGKPSFETLWSVMEILNLKFEVVSKAAAVATNPPDNRNQRITFRAKRRTKRQAKLHTASVDQLPLFNFSGTGTVAPAVGSTTSLVVTQATQHGMNNILNISEITPAYMIAALQGGEQRLSTL